MIPLASYYLRSISFCALSKFNLMWLLSLPLFTIERDLVGFTVNTEQIYFTSLLLFMPLERVSLSTWPTERTTIRYGRLIVLLLVSAITDWLYCSQTRLFHYDQLTLLLSAITDWPYCETRPDTTQSLYPRRFLLYFFLSKSRYHGSKATISVYQERHWNWPPYLFH